MKSIFKKCKELKVMKAKSYLTISIGLMKVADDIDDNDPERFDYYYEALKYLTKAFMLMGRKTFINL